MHKSSLIVADLLAASMVPAVRAVVGKASSKRLDNLLTGDRRRAVLAPSWRVLGEAILWAEKTGLPVIPVEKISEIAPDVGVVPRTFGRLQQFERDSLDGCSLAAVSVSRRDALPPNARGALRPQIKGCWLLRRVVQLADDD